jgi:phage-related protein
VADFTLAPDFVFEEKPQYNTLITNFENGVEQRRPTRSTAIREWTLQYRNRSSADMQTVLDLFNSKKGAYTAFDWTNPEDSVDYTVRFKEDSLTKTMKHYGIYDFQFVLVEVL